VAKKRQARPAAKKASTKPRKAAAKTTAKKAAKASPKTQASAPATRAAASSRSAGVGLMELAARLRDEIQRSKHTHSDPWTYTAKARPWSERAEVLVAQIVVGGDTSATRRALEALDVEVRADRDFQEARRLF
jgi:hypothetical protein